MPYCPVLHSREGTNLPVADWFFSFTGGVFNPATQTGDAFSFNFAVNGDGILAFQP